MIDALPRGQRGTTQHSTAQQLGVHRSGMRTASPTQFQPVHGPCTGINTLKHKRDGDCVPTVLRRRAHRQLTWAARRRAPVLLQCSPRSTPPPDHAHIPLFFWGKEHAQGTWHLTARRGKREWARTRTQSLPLALSAPQAPRLLGSPASCRLPPETRCHRTQRPAHQRHGVGRLASPPVRTLHCWYRSRCCHKHHCHSMHLRVQGRMGLQHTRTMANTG